jgi:hypothetical protein
MKTKLELMAEHAAKKTCWSNKSQIDVFGYGWMEGYITALEDLQDEFLNSTESDPIVIIRKMFDLDSKKVEDK